MTDPNTTPYFAPSVRGAARTAAASGAYLDFVEVQNANTSQVFLQLFNALSENVVLGTTRPVLSLLVPAGNGVESGAMDKMFYHAPHFRAGISYAITATAAGTRACDTPCQVNFVYH